MRIAPYLLPSLLGLLPAQAVVIPALRASTDGSSGGALAGADQRFRMQVLLDAGALGSVAGHAVTSVAFRRDGQHREAWQGGRANLTVRLSTSPRPSAEAVATFAANHGADLLDVFAGEIVVPATPPLATRDGAQWSAPDAIAISFDRPFPYVGGTLCVEIEGAPVVGSVSPWWRIDHELYGHNAQVATSGVSCDGFSNAFASRNTLLPGGSLDLICTGPRGATAVLLLGASAISPGLDLGFLGAPGCRASVLPATTIAAIVGVGPATGYAAANLTLQLPPAPWLAGSRLHAQWAVFPNPHNGALLTTTNALELTVASLPSPLPGLLVRTGPLGASEPWPASGRVYPQLLPVVQVGYR